MENRRTSVTESAPSRLAQREMDPAELWQDERISPEDLIRLDPLDIDYEMVERAERPELADPLIAFLPDGAVSVWAERVWFRAFRAQTRDVGAQRRLVQKLWGSK